ncbi:MAG: hypothetical protein WCH99_15665 [Verrucomicrobiota bacterium]
MKPVFRILLLVIIGALFVWLWIVFFPSPEKVIQRKISSLAATATISANVSNITRVGKANALVNLFAFDAQIIIAVSGQNGRTISGRDEIREAALAGFTSLPALNVEFLDVTVRLGADKQTAELSCTAKVNAGDRKDYGVQEMRFQWKKVDGDWLIVRAETVKTLS